MSMTSLLMTSCRKDRQNADRKTGANLELHVMYDSAPWPTSLRRERNGMRRCGMYFEGFVDGEKVAECLENHRKDTASTFGTRSSRHVGTCGSQTATENVSCISIHKNTIN